MKKKNYLKIIMIVLYSILLAYAIYLLLIKLFLLLK